MRTCLAMALVALSASSAGAQWEFEATVGGAYGNRFTRPAPFDFRGVRFEGPYACHPLICAARLRTEYYHEETYGPGAMGGLALRRSLSRSVSFGAGILAGLSAREERIERRAGTELAGEDEPVEPDAVLDAALDEGNAGGRYTGVGALAYVHAGLRLERGFETRDVTGYRPTRARVFLVGGAGKLLAIPGGGRAGVKAPFGLHVAAGVRIRGSAGRATTFGIFLLRAFPERPPGLTARPHWIGVQVGWTFRRSAPSQVGRPASIAIARPREARASRSPSQP